MITATVISTIGWLILGLLAAAKPLRDLARRQLPKSGEGGTSLRSGLKKSTAHVLGLCFAICVPAARPHRSDSPLSPA